MKITASSLDEFVQETDRRGGPGTADTLAYWSDFEFSSAIVFDETLDPYSEAYCRKQLELYQELSGRNFDQDVNEFTPIDLERHVAGANPYAATNASQFAIHFTRLSIMIGGGDLPQGAKILDMGAGWGLSSEFFGTLGCQVMAVDINPSFVELIKRRQLRHRLAVDAQMGAFDTFEATETYDAVVFYECLHHAYKPWLLLERARDWLKPVGKILFAGEPIYHGWQHWGMRLDPLSVYCVRKFGWFETGWSERFIGECLLRAGFLPRIQLIGLPDVGYVCAATKLTDDVLYTPGAIRGLIENESEWYIEQDYLVTKGDSEIRLPLAGALTQVELHVQNFKGEPINLTIVAADGNITKHLASPGKSLCLLQLSSSRDTYRIYSDAWIPHEYIKNGDNRSLSLHLFGLKFKKIQSSLVLER